MVNIPIDKKLYYRVKNQAKKKLIHGLQHMVLLG